MPLVSTPEVKSLLESIDESSPLGIFNEEDSLYIEIDDEMIKLGGLQSATIDWDKVEKDSIQFLKEHCKHIRVMGYLVQCWLKKNSWKAWCDACNLLAGFCDLYFLQSYPKPEEKGLPAKQKLYASLIERIKSSADLLANSHVDKQILPDVIQTIEFLSIVSKKIQCANDPQDVVDHLYKKFQKLSKAPPPSSNRPTASPTKQGEQGISSSFFSAQQTVPSSIANERDLRKTLLALAQTANQHDAYDPVGYLLRRYALWSSITSSPITVKEGITELMPVPAEIVQEYQNALDTNKIDPVLLHKVESSVQSSVYWFKGSYFACQYAKQLEMEEVAFAIWGATKRFVSRIPVLLKLHFKDGSPFADEATIEWITTPVSSNVQPTSQAMADADYLKLHKQLSKQMEKNGIESVLQTLEKQQGRDLSPRQKCQYMKVTADLLSERGLSWLAKEFYQRIEQKMNEIVASQWEPELYAQVSATNIDADSRDNKGAHQL